MTFCSIVNILSFKMEYSGESTFAAIITILGSPSFLSTFGSRAFFNLKEAAGLEVYTQASNSHSFHNTLETVSGLQFAGRSEIHSSDI